MEDEPEIQVFSQRSKKLIGKAGSDSFAAAAIKRIRGSNLEKGIAELARASNDTAQQVRPPSAVSTGHSSFNMCSVCIVTFRDHHQHDTILGSVFSSSGVPHLP